LSLSFNNDGPLGTFFRYIGDTATYIARYDDLFNGKDEKIDVSQVDVSMNGIELQDREFFAAIREGREPNCCTIWSSSSTPDERALWRLPVGPVDGVTGPGPPSKPAALATALFDSARRAAGLEGGRSSLT